MSQTWAPGERYHLATASLGDSIAHSALWSAVSHVVRHQPMAVVVVVGIVAALYLAHRSRRTRGGARRDR